MIKSVWTAYFSQDENAQATDDFPAPPNATIGPEHEELLDYDEAEEQDRTPELHDENDQWEVEEEAADWLQETSGLDIQPKQHRQARPIAPTEIEVPTTEAKPDSQTRAQHETTRPPSPHNEEEEAQTNEQLIHHLMAQIPEYDWMEEAPPESQHNVDNISILPTPLGIQYGKKERRGSNMSKGEEASTRPRSTRSPVSTQSGTGSIPYGGRQGSRTT